ncbi:MOSC-domain-containing protein [Lophiostoma macrostomum CBS 122681]|uniref:MOSC-domain-containing protein n=1 Tax=Lophiostoma macrostomum CBS 122681 TaxID=1314788 RepID=A0A6A6TBS6_9PLEO|nr:MOSC-domain-containing protein [Lophiostoma macrostomum CBS 122681]
MLLQKTAEGYKNMAVSKYPEMTQFLTNILPPDQDSPTSGSIEVEPDTTKLEPLKIDMHGSPTDAFQMPAEYSTWFSECFGYEVVLAYLGNNLRDVLFEDMNTKTAKSAFSRLLASLPVLGTYSTSDYKITFADCSPYLITSKTSLADVSARLPDGEEMDMTKFRPNIVVTGAKDAYEEDYWGSLDINGAKVTLAHNCVRCSSLNVDYNTGKPGTGESGQVLKKLQKDRRVDPGHKWSPVFGRYSFWNSRQGPKTLSVGDEVKVTKVNIQRTKWNWPGI